MEENNNLLHKHFDDVEDALNFLVSNKCSQPRNIDKQKLKAAVAIFTESSKNGLSSTIIKKLSFTIIFDDQYDIPTRRKLLYSCIPESRDFPYEIIPLAISTAASPNISSTWQLSIVSWLLGLLHFHIIDESHKLIHACYPVFFNLLSNLKTCGVVCKILHQITRREDVTPCRTQILLRLEKKIGFCQHIPNLLRIYNLFRPDLAVIRLDKMKRFPTIPKWFEAPLLSAKLRLEEDDEAKPQDGHHLWPQFVMRRKAKPFHEPFVVPQPEILVYADKIEEKKERMVSVLQFRRIKDMIKNMSEWQEWRWPNSPPCLLWKPVAIALFKPDDVYVKVAITNWLELALRAEVIEQLGNPSKERQRNLLTACVQLVKQTETLVPAVFHFIIEFFTRWDKYSHMPQILELLSLIPFISPSSFFENILESVSQILTVASLPLFCAIINALANTSLTWALQAQKEGKYYRKCVDWPYDLSEVFPLEGIHFLSQRLERIFSSAILRFGDHPLLLVTCINYYTKVNMCCEELCLPLFILPPPEFIFVVLSSSDLVATHQIGNLLSIMQKRVEFLKNYKATGDEKLMRSVSLSYVDSINFSVIVYLDSIVTSKGFSDRWMEILSPFFSESFLKKLMSFQSMNHYGSVCRALPYLPFTAQHIIESSDYLRDREKRNGFIEEIIERLASMNLEGIRTCARTYMSQE